MRPESLIVAHVAGCRSISASAPCVRVRAYERDTDFARQSATSATRRFPQSTLLIAAQAVVRLSCGPRGEVLADEWQFSLAHQLLWQLVHRRAAFIEQVSLLIEDALPCGLSASNRDTRAPFVCAAAYLDQQANEPEVHFALHLSTCDAELRSEFIRVHDPLASPIASEPHRDALQQLGRRDGLRLTVARAEEARDLSVPDMTGMAAILIEVGDCVDEFHRAQRDPEALPRSAEALRRLAPIDRRHVLSSFAALHRPEPRL